MHMIVYYISGGNYRLLLTIAICMHATLILRLAYIKAHSVYTLTTIIIMVQNCNVCVYIRHYNNIIINPRRNA